MKKEVKIGIIVLSAAVALFVGINFLKGKNLFAKQTYYYAVYNNIDGLTASCPVNLNGYKVGQVSKISLLNDNSGRLLVELLFTENIKVLNESEVRIISSDFLGSKAVSLTLKGTTVLQSGDTLKSSVEQSLSETVNATVAPLKAKTESLLGSLDTLVNAVKLALNKKTSENISNTFQNIYRTFDNIEKISAKMEGSLDFEKIQGLLNSYKLLADNINANQAQLDNVFKNLSAVSDSLTKVNFTKTVANVNAVMNEFSVTLDKVNKGQGTMGALINNDSLYNNLNKSSQDLDKLLIDMREHPSRYVHFSIFGKKDKAPK